MSGAISRHLLSRLREAATAKPATSKLRVRTTAAALPRAPPRRAANTETVSDLDAA